MNLTLLWRYRMQSDCVGCLWPMVPQEEHDESLMNFSTSSCSAVPFWVVPHSQDLFTVKHQYLCRSSGEDGEVIHSTTFSYLWRWALFFSGFMVDFMVTLTLSYHGSLGFCTEYNPLFSFKSLMQNSMNISSESKWIFTGDVGFQGGSDGHFHMWRFKPPFPSPFTSTPISPTINFR